MTTKKVVARGYGWLGKDGSTIYMQRCYKCGAENYAPAVSSGRCAWCRFDANTDEKLVEEVTEAGAAGLLREVTA